jgi:hypothetical protein
MSQKCYKNVHFFVNNVTFFKVELTKCSKNKGNVTFLPLNVTKMLYFSVKSGRNVQFLHKMLQKCSIFEGFMPKSRHFLKELQ